MSSEIHVMYRVTLVVEYLGWVDIDLDVPPSLHSDPANPAKPPSARQKQPDCGMGQMISHPNLARYSTTRVTLYQYEKCLFSKNSGVRSCSGHSLSSRSPSSSPSRDGPRRRRRRPTEIGDDAFFWNLYSDLCLLVKTHLATG